LNGAPKYARTTDKKGSMKKKTEPVNKKKVGDLLGHAGERGLSPQKKEKKKVPPPVGKQKLTEDQKGPVTCGHEKRCLKSPPGFDTKKRSQPKRDKILIFEYSRSRAGTHTSES